MVDALVKAAERCRQQAANNVVLFKTGRLREHEIISVATQSSANVAIVRVGPDMSAFYGLWAEIGSAHQSRTPFLLPAFDETKAAVYEEMSKNFIEAIEEII